MRRGNTLHMDSTSMVWGPALDKKEMQLSTSICLSPGMDAL